MSINKFAKNSFAKTLIEVCVGSLEGAIGAELAGADRIELNLALELDGLTPSAGLVTRVTQVVKLPIVAMARPRGGDFFYSGFEWDTLIADARWLLEQGVSGIAFGCLGRDRQIDLKRCEQMRELAGSRELVFHKAFDEVDGWETGLNGLVETGIDRVMTSGQAATASEGVGLISQLVERAAGRIEILPAGRIGSENGAEIIECTGCDQLHGSYSMGENHDVSAEIGRLIAKLATRLNPS